MADIFAKFQCQKVEHRIIEIDWLCMHKIDDWSI